MASLNVVRTTFFYPDLDIPVLKDLDIRVTKGSVHLILGESGSGKSTLIHAIAGIIPQHIEGNYSGKLLDGGEDITHLEIQHRAARIGLVFQDPDCQFCTFTVEDELAFAMENLRYARERMEARVNELLELFGIGHLRGKPLTALSGGEKQKVAIASVLSLDPEVVILDEPTANLDPASTGEIFGLIRRLKEEQGKTVVIVEHKLDKLIPLVDEVSILGGEGRCVFAGTAKAALTYLVRAGEAPAIHVPTTGFHPLIPQQTL